MVILAWTSERGVLLGVHYSYGPKLGVANASFIVVHVLQPKIPTMNTGYILHRFSRIRSWSITQGQKPIYDRPSNKDEY